MQWEKRHRLALILLLIALAWSVPRVLSPSIRMQRYAKLLEKNLHKREEKAEEKLHQIARQLQKKEQLLFPLFEQTDADYNLALYREGQLVSWLNRRVLPGSPPALHADTDSLTGLWKQSDLQHFGRYKNGWFAIRAQRFYTSSGDFQAFLFFPLRDAYNLPHAEAGFYPQGHLPKSLSFSSTPTDYPIRWKNGRTLTWLEAPSPLPPDKLSLRLILLFLLPAALLLLLEINRLAIELSRRYQAWLGMLFLFGSLLGLRAASIYFGWFDHLKSLPLFAHTLKTQVVNNSLGELLINIFLLLWFVVFFQKEFPLQPIQAPGPITRFSLAVLYHLSIITAILLITSSLQRLVVQSDIAFDFENVFNLELPSLLAISGAVLLVLVLFLFSHRMAQAVAQIRLNMLLRMTTATIAILPAYPLYKISGLELPLLQTAVAVLIAIGLLNFYLESGRPNLTWLMSWLIILSGFTSLLLYKFNGRKEMLNIEEIARQLAPASDSLAEIRLQDISRALALTNLKVEECRKILQDKFKQDFYLSAWYDWSLEKTRKKTKNPNPTRLWKLDSLEQKYLLTLCFTTEKNDCDSLLQISIFRKNHRIPTAYELTSLTPPYRKIKELHTYDYAIYRKGKQTEQSPGEYYPLEMKVPPIPRGKLLQNPNKADRLEYFYCPDKDTLIVLSRTTGGFLKPLSLFSYLFALLFLSIFFLSLLNRRFHFLPENMYLARINENSLGNKIQYWMIGLTLISFFSIGLITAWHFQKSADIERERQIRQRIYALTKDLQNLLQKRSAENHSEHLRKLSERHQLDFNLFDKNGKLLYSSEAGIYVRQICEPVALYPALMQLQHSGTGKLQLYPDRLIRDLPFLSIYLNVQRNSFLSVPYYKSREEVRQSVADFIGTLLNVYVFLLLITSSVALAVTESITLPLKNLRNNLQRMQLGKINRPIPLEDQEQDEVGMLIAEYNQMLHKLEESAKKLAESERESAWREMAKQVAHEIKNPLTPMRLSIQHLEMAYRRNPQKATEMIEKVSRRLLEQIDTLTNIATAFSSYAKMPAPENEKFALNELLQSVFELFQKERPDMDFKLELSEETLHVYADRSQLLRVINNLLKNAMQAIPPDRKGQVELRLKKEQNKALISISDNGIGIPEELQDKVFRPNFTTKSSGSGLGLAMTKNIVQSTQGRIWFETQLNKGTTFFVELPLSTQPQKNA